METREKHSILFKQLVIMFHSATMQQLGKIKNPLTDKLERDLLAAQGSIDLLEMLQEKTRGNLQEDEGKLLTQILQECRLNYVDETNKPEPPPPPSEKTDKS